MTEKMQIEEVLSSKGFFIKTTAGISMKPLFRDRCDRSVIVPVTKPLKKYDVVLYRRDNDLVLHRIIKISGDTLIIRGDNCINLEYVRKEQIIGVLSEFYRGEKHYTVENISYKIYSRFWVSTHPIRDFIRKTRTKLGKLYRRVWRKNG